MVIPAGLADAQQLMLVSKDVACTANFNPVRFSRVGDPEAVCDPRVT
jgi:hypothetical protein